jgi:hypothetical protein
MATKILKTLTRLVETDKGSFIIALDPRGPIAIREKGKRTTFFTTIGKLYLLAAAAAAEEIRVNRRHKRRLDGFLRKL